MTEKDLMLIEKAKTMHWMDIDEDGFKEQADTKEAMEELDRISRHKYHMEEERIQFFIEMDE